MRNKRNSNSGNSLSNVCWNPTPFGGMNSGQELTRQNEILEMQNASGILSPPEYLAVLSQTSGFSKIWFKFCLRPSLLES